MAEKPPSAPARAKAPTGPKVSGARTAVSVVLLVIVLIVCVIEVRAGLGQYLTLKSFAAKSKDNIFDNVSLSDAQSMISMFPSSPEVTKGEAEDTYHYRWYSLLRPLAGKEVPELYVSADHSDPPRALSFYTSTDGEPDFPPHDPNAVDAAPPTGMGGMPMGGGGPGGFGGGGPRGGGPGGPPGGGRERPALEDEEPATTEPATTEPAAKEEPASTEPAKSDDSAAPAATEPGDSPKADEEAAAKDEKTEAPAEPN